MKRIVALTAIVIILLGASAYASNTYGLAFPREVSISNGSKSPFTENEAVSDDVMSKGVKTVTVKQAQGIGHAGDMMEPDFSNVMTSPFPLMPYEGNPVLTASMVKDRQAGFVADPFMFYEDNEWYMFFEVWSSAVDQDVGLATSSDGFHWTYQKIVLDEPGHLAYPYVFKCNGDYYMVCDPCLNIIKIYKATSFPYSWASVASVTSSSVWFADPSLVYYNRMWWMFVSDTSSRNCYLYYATSLTGPWTEHPKSPVIRGDASEARGGGRVGMFGSRLLRFVQKCDVRYGEMVRAFQVDTLTTTSFAEHEISESPVLVPSGSGWNANGMHALDPWWTGNSWLAVADGYNRSTGVYSIGMYYRESRDVAVISVVPSTVHAVSGTIINISVTAKNEGAMTETFNVATYYDNNKIGTQTVTDLASGATGTLTFNWNTNALQPGNYTIRAEASTVPDETDTADNVCVDGTVRIVKPPVASFTYFPSNPRVNELVLFNASSSTPNGGAITNYRWNFDDGNITSTPNPATTHMYSIPRTYNVTLTVIDSEGLDASAWKSIRLVKPPVASLTYFPSNPRVNEPVLFDASSSAPNGGTITSYRWNFDDGNITSTPDPATTHVYTIPRTYNVTLTVTDSEGLNASVWNSIMISALVQTEISIFTYSSSDFVGFKVEINGTLADPEGKGMSDANIVISYTLSGVSEWVPFISVTTDFEGNYYSQWIPPSIGDFILRSEWVGNQSYAGASKNTALSIIPYQDKYIFSVASNSTISALTFNSTSQELRFNASGPSNTTGFARVTMAKTLVANATKLKLYLDEKPLACSTFSAGDSWVVSFTYTHSAHHIMLILNSYRLHGDVNNDGRVDMLDLSIVAVVFGSRPTDIGWNSAADLDNNGVVNIVDISIVARQYGKEV